MTNVTSEYCNQDDAAHHQGAAQDPPDVQAVLLAAEQAEVTGDERHGNTGCNIQPCERTGLDLFTNSGPTITAKAPSKPLSGAHHGIEARPSAKGTGLSRRKKNTMKTANIGRNETMLVSQRFPATCVADSASTTVMNPSTTTGNAPTIAHTYSGPPTACPSWARPCRRSRGMRPARRPAGPLAAPAQPTTGRRARPGWPRSAATGCVTAQTQTLDHALQAFAGAGTEQALHIQRCPCPARLAAHHRQ